MNKTQLTAVATALYVLISSTALGQSGSSPRGKPFVAINDQIVEIEGTVASLQDQIDALVARVDTVEERVGANESAITILQFSIAELQNMILADMTYIQSIENEIAILEMQVADLETQMANFSIDLQSQIDQLNWLIGDLQAALLAMQTDTTDGLTALQDQIDNNETLISVLQGQIDQLNASLAIKQNIIAGQCPDGQAVVEVTEDSIVCQTSGSGPGTLALQTIFVGVTRGPGLSVDIRRTCSPGYVPVNSGFVLGPGGNVRTSSISSDAFNFSAVNDSPNFTNLTAVFNCLGLQ